MNRFCPVKKVLLGDEDLVKNLKGRVSKANFVSIIYDEVTKTEKANNVRRPKKKFSTHLASVIPKEASPEPEEKIVRANFTGLTDEDLFGPAFLYEEPELFM